MPKAQKGGLFGFGESSSPKYGNSYGYGYGSSVPNITTETGISSGVLQYFYYFIVVLLIVLAVLILVNYTLYPVFKTRPGAKGVIPLPGTDDSKIYWKNSNSIKIIDDKETPVSTQFQDWSMILDVQIDNPTSNTDYPRILFSRGDALAQPDQPFNDQSTIRTINPNFNVCFWLERMTNDLNITVQTQTENNTISLETIQIPNVPVGKATRFGVMVGSRVLEVYVNGYLVKSVTYTTSLRGISGGFQPPLNEVLSSVARVANLHLWGRPLSPAEFRSYGGAKDLTAKPLPDSCAR
jgi:hypothetical protein